MTGALVVVAVLTACTAPATSAASEGSFAEAREVNLEFKAAVAEVQKQVFGGEWRVGAYGDTPKDCGGGYEFSLRRELPDGSSFDGQGPQRMDELRTWLSNNGWQLAPTPTYGEGIDNIVIVAGKPEAKVSRLDVDMIPGVAAEGTIDVLELGATSTCEPGDAHALFEQVRGPFSTVPRESVTPSMESPDATPLFERFAEG